MTTPAEEHITADPAALAHYISGDSANALLQAAWQGILEAKVLRQADGKPFDARVTVTNGEATVFLGLDGTATWDDLHPFKASVIDTLANTLAAMINSPPQSEFHFPIRPWSRN